jgi:FdhD protein
MHVDTRLAREPFMQRTMISLRSTRSVSWGLAVEAPIEIALNGVPWTVMLGTPADVVDLAIGVALTEGVLRDAAAVREVEVSEFLHDIAVNLVVPVDQLDESARRSRSLQMNSACGLCGLESIAQLRARPRRARAAGSDTAPIADAAVLAAFAELPAHQPLNRATRSVHAAAWCALDGEILLAREDVGRHNALDKLIGALAQRALLAGDGFIVMSSRCSYELVYKAALTDARLLATISAPTSMAVEWSAALGLPLACRAGDDIVRVAPEASDAT